MKGNTALKMKRQAEVIELRKQGYTIAEIARKLNIPLSTVGDACEAAMRAWRQEFQATRADMVHLDLARLDAMLKALWNKVKEGEVKSIQCAIKVLERRAKLAGLDAPILTQIAPLYSQQDQQKLLEIINDNTTPVGETVQLSDNTTPDLPATEGT